MQAAGPAEVEFGAAAVVNQVGVVVGFGALVQALGVAAGEAPVAALQAGGEVGAVPAARERVRLPVGLVGHARHGVAPLPAKGQGAQAGGGGHHVHQLGLVVGVAKRARVRVVVHLPHGLHGEGGPQVGAGQAEVLQHLGAHGELEFRFFAPVVRLVHGRLRGGLRRAVDAAGDVDRQHIVLLVADEVEDAAFVLGVQLPKFGEQAAAAGRRGAGRCGGRQLPARGREQRRLGGRGHHFAWGWLCRGRQRRGGRAAGQAVVADEPVRRGADHGTLLQGGGGLGGRGLLRVQTGGAGGHGAEEQGVGKGRRRAQKGGGAAEVWRGHGASSVPVMSFQ